jgi:hypothetical protein
MGLNNSKGFAVQILIVGLWGKPQPPRFGCAKAGFVSISQFKPVARRSWKNKKPFQLKLEGFLCVGVAGFEPTTSCSQSRRDTGLRYTPNWHHLSK